MLLKTKIKEALFLSMHIQRLSAAPLDLGMHEYTHNWLQFSVDACINIIDVRKYYWCCKEHTMRFVKMTRILLTLACWLGDLIEKRSYSKPCVVHYNGRDILPLFWTCTMYNRAIASLPGFKVLPLRQFGSWGPEITTKLDPQKDTYVMVCTTF